MTTTLTAPSPSGDGAAEVEPELARLPVSSAAVAPRGIAGFLSDLLGRISRGIKGMVPLVFAAGCQSPASEPPRPAPQVEAAPSVSVAEEPAPAPPAEEGPRQIGKFNITFYYVVGEEEMIARANRRKAAANENRAASPPAEGSGGVDPAAAAAATPDAGTDLAAAAPPETVTIYGPGPGTECDPIVETTREFAYELAIQGTGKLRDGRVLNVWGPCNCPNTPCFRVTEQQWGMAGTGRPLQPFRTVAVDPKVVKLGSLLHIPLLEGRTMPGREPWGGYVHDGCVVADDTGGAIRGHHIDLFVGRRGWFLGMSGSGGGSSWARGVPVYDGSRICERKGRKVSRKSGAI